MAEYCQFRSPIASPKLYATVIAVVVGTMQQEKSSLQTTPQPFPPENAENQVDSIIHRFGVDKANLYEKLIYRDFWEWLTALDHRSSSSVLTIALDGTGSMSFSLTSAREPSRRARHS